MDQTIVIEEGDNNCMLYEYPEYQLANFLNKPYDIIIQVE